MKITGYPKANPLLHSPSEASNSVDKATRGDGKEPVRKDQSAAAQTPLRGKIRIPRDYEPKVALDAREQAFFEKLYPKARKEIQAYLKQQNKVVPQKGQFVDVKG